METERQSKGCCGGPRKWKRDGDVRRNCDLEEALVPPARCLRCLHCLDECPQDHPWKAQRNKEPTDSTVPGVSEIKARNDRQRKHYDGKAVHAFEFTPKARIRVVAVRFHSSLPWFRIDRSSTLETSDGVYRFSVRTAARKILIML